MKYNQVRRYCFKIWWEKNFIRKLLIVSGRDATVCRTDAVPTSALAKNQCRCRDEPDLAKAMPIPCRQNLIMEYRCRAEKCRKVGIISAFWRWFSDTMTVTGDQQQNLADASSEEAIFSRHANKISRLIMTSVVGPAYRPGMFSIGYGSLCRMCWRVTVNLVLVCFCVIYML